MKGSLLLSLAIFMVLITKEFYWGYIVGLVKQESQLQSKSVRLCIRHALSISWKVTEVMRYHTRALKLCTVKLPLKSEVWLRGFFLGGCFVLVLGIEHSVLFRRGKHSVTELQTPPPLLIELTDLYRWGKILISRNLFAWEDSSVDKGRAWQTWKPDLEVFKKKHSWEDGSLDKVLAGANRKCLKGLVTTSNPSAQKKETGSLGKAAWIDYSGSAWNLLR